MDNQVKYDKLSVWQIKTWQIIALIVLTILFVAFWTVLSGWAGVGVWYTIMSRPYVEHQEVSKQAERDYIKNLGATKQLNKKFISNKK